MESADNSETHAHPHTDGADVSTRCEGCKSCGAVLELDCGHRFHPRCIYAWPATHCEACDAAVTVVRVFRECKGPQNTVARKGKWGIDEHKYADMMMKQFQLGALPLPNGLHLRVFMANILQCDPLRVTKKYAGQSIGKQNFFYQQRKNYCYNLHLKLQKQVSNLRNHYYWHIQYRCNLGHSLNIQALKAAEADYWVREFRRFAAKIGQQVEPSAAAITPAKAREATKLKEPAKQDVAQNDLVPLLHVAAETLSAPKSVSLPPIRTLCGGELQLKVENLPLSAKRLPDEDSMAPSMKDELGLMSGCSVMERSVSPLSADEWSDPSTLVDIALADTTSIEEALSAQDTGDLKKKAWIADMMKDAELEWSKGAISWSLSLSSEPLSDFA